MIRPARVSARTALAGLITASVIGAGAAVAIDHAGSAGPSISAIQAAAAAAASPKPSPSPGKRPPFRVPGIAGIGGVGALGFGAGEILGVLTKDTGLTPMQLFQDIRNGQTLDQIAGSNDAKVKTDALAAVKKGLDAAVSRNVITSTQETSLLGDAKDMIDQLMAAKLGNAGMVGLPFGGGFDGPLGGRHPKVSPKPSPSAQSTATT